MLASRSLRDRIALEQPVRVQNPHTGAMDISWERYDTNVPAGPPPTKANVTAHEALTARSAGMVLDRKIAIRARSDIRHDHRVFYQNEYYNIIGILPVEDLRSRYLVLLLSLSLTANENLVQY